MGAIDWSGLGDETVELLRQYLAIDTTNPPGNEVAGTRFLAEALGRQSIDSQTVESAPGRANLVARLRGDGSLGGIVLHHHIDVVYADRRYWTVDPFGGVIKDGYLYGRGALDMKSTGILQLAGDAGDQARADSAQARSHLPGHRRRGSRQRLRRPLPGRSASRLVRRRGVRAVGAGRHRAARRVSRAVRQHRDLGEDRAAAEADGAQRARPRLDAVARDRASPAGPSAGPPAGGRPSAARAARGRRVLPADGARAAAGRRPRLRRHHDLAARSRVPRPLPGRSLSRRDRAHDLRRQHAAGQREAQRDPAGGGGRHRLPHAGRRRSPGDPAPGCAA